MDSDTILSLIIGCAFTWFTSWYFLVPSRLKSILFLKTMFNDSTNWFCVWQEDNNSNKWITDEVKIVKKYGKLVIKVINPGDQYIWQYSGQFRNGYLIGEFKSTRKGSVSLGSIVLKLNPQGNIMAGYHIGPTNKSKLNSGKVILVDEMSNIEKIKINFSNYT